MKKLKRPIKIPISLIDKVEIMEENEEPVYGFGDVSEVAGDYLIVIKRNNRYKNNGDEE